MEWCYSYHAVYPLETKVRWRYKGGKKYQNSVGPNEQHAHVQFFLDGETLPDFTQANDCASRATIAVVIIIVVIVRMVVWGVGQLEFDQVLLLLIMA